MSSIRRVQTERLLQDVVRTLYADGVQPTLNEVLGRIARYLSINPAGSPLELPLNDAVAAGVSDPEEYNRLLANLSVNVDVLYESSLRQVEEVVLLTSSLQSHLSRLKAQRRRIEGTIDDYLLSLYNTDGYYYSISDNFSDIGYVDLSLTSAQIDTSVGMAVLPSLASGTMKLPVDLVSAPSIEVTAGGKSSSYTELAPFTGALEDTLDNIVWAFEVGTEKPVEVVAMVRVELGNGTDPISLSRVDITPYGAAPVQVYMETRDDARTSSSGWQTFGHKIQTASSKMVFSNSAKDVFSFRMMLRKTEPDYTENVGGQLRYKYIFGAKELAFLHQVYDMNARVVSQPLYLPVEYDQELVIDAVSIDVDDDIPPDTDINYYVAASDGSEQAFDEINWQQIVPIASNEPGEKVVRFSGAAVYSRMIRDNPIGDNLQLIPLSTTGSLNPSPFIIPGVDTYRIAQFKDNVLPNSLKLIEGVNTTKIYSRNIDNTKAFGADIDLDYWANELNTNSKLTLDYGRIDAGNEFFYGGDVGASGKDIYVETYIDCDQTYPTFLEEFQKIDVRSQTWDVKIYLNGKPIGHLPVGTPRMQLPWSLRQGLNHIVLLVRIPLAASETHAFMGALNLMGDQDLENYGSVQLGKWHFVDFFTMQYNESGGPSTFTIHNGEIISRRKPTGNFRLQYATGTGSGPVAVRFRADLSRSRNNPNVTPRVQSYRVRFSYADGGT